jgi:hypothetical protein
MVFIIFSPDEKKANQKICKNKEWKKVYFINLHLLVLPAALVHNGERSEETSDPDRHFDLVRLAKWHSTFKQVASSFSVLPYLSSFHYSLLVLRYRTHKFIIVVKCTNKYNSFLTQIASWEADSRADSKNVPYLLRITNVHYRVHLSPQSLS